MNEAQARPAPGWDRANFHHLVLDIAWFGLAIPATTRFLSVYAIRLGATPLELGWLSALPALVLLFSAALSGWWRRHYTDTVQAVFWPSLGFRLVFLLPALAPLLPSEWQVPWLILSVVLPALPQGVAGVMFMVLMREGIDRERLTPLLSRRTVVLDVTVAAGGLCFGLWLENTVFPYGYQVMFLVAFLLALASQWHVIHIRVPVLPSVTMLTYGRTGARPWRTPGFQRVALVAALSHVVFLFVVPLIPLRLVDELGAAEGFMSLYALAELAAGATVAVFTDRLIRHFGNRTVIALAMVGTALGAVVLALAVNLYVTLIAAALMGGSWTAAAIALFDFFTENTPAEEMTRFTTAYHQTIFVATFIGPLLGSGLADLGVTLVTVLLIGAGLRIVAAAVIQGGVIGKLLARVRRAQRSASAEGEDAQSGGLPSAAAESSVPFTDR